MSPFRPFFERYAAAFEAFDAAAVAAHYALPALFVRDGQPEAVADAGALTASVEALLALHRAWDVETARALHVAEAEAAPAHRVVRVEWRLGRRASRLRWRYATTYVLVPAAPAEAVPEPWRIVAALTHDAPFPASAPPGDEAASDDAAEADAPGGAPRAAPA